MPNTYTYTGPGTRWAAEDATAEDFLNVSRINCDHLHEALNEVIDTTDPTVGQKMSIATSFKFEPVSGTTWSFGWWQAANNQWYLLCDTAGADAFTRADAEFYIPIAGVVNPDGSLAVPTS